VELLRSPDFREDLLNEAVGSAVLECECSQHRIELKKQRPEIVVRLNSSFHKDHATVASDHQSGR
jgi:hypothetical protein